MNEICRLGAGELGRLYRKRELSPVEATPGTASGQPPEARTGAVFPKTPSKTCSGLFLGRLPEDYNLDAALEEMNEQWKTKLQDLGLQS